MCRVVFWTLWERVRVGWFGRMALKHVYDRMWNKSPVQVRCMIQGARGWCTGMTQRDGTGLPYSPWNSPYQNTGVGSLSLLQGIFPTHGLNPGLLHCRWILYQLSHKGIPAIVIGQKAAHDKLLPKYKSSARCIVRPNNTKIKLITFFEAEDGEAA